LAVYDEIYGQRRGRAFRRSLFSGIRIPEKNKAETGSRGKSRRQSEEYRKIEQEFLIRKKRSLQN